MAKQEKKEKVFFVLGDSYLFKGGIHRERKGERRPEHRRLKKMGMEGKGSTITRNIITMP